MPHLGSFRKGWQSENLARYILYKFSFVAHPSTIADDVGADFFCTLFDVQKEGSQDYLLPKGSFAIQIKSSTDRIDISNKLHFLENLELPFFVGVADREDLKITFFSGQFIPEFFSYKGIPESLEIELCSESSISEEGYFYELAPSKYVLRFPKTVEFGVDTAGEELRTRVKNLWDTCSLMQENIASKRSGEYLFKSYRNGNQFVTIYSGSVSVKSYRNNLAERLAEAFVNLKWVYEIDSDRFVMGEFRAYEQLLNSLSGLEEYGPFPGYVFDYYKQLKDLVG